MTDNPYAFDIPEHHKSIIMVIGVGGGGSNALNHMYNQGIKDVEFVVCNTDSQALMCSPVPNKLQIGTKLTSGLGAGANPEKGMNAALESKEEIRNMLSESIKMVFITAGMGGGTGTGAAPVIAKVARELDILTVGIVTMPFGFEGKKKMQQAIQGIAALKESCDTVLVILNDKLRNIYGNLAIRDAFAQADNVLTTAAKGIAEIITVPGYVNVDFEDVKTVMSNSGSAVMGSACTEGENRAKRAAEEALASPLLNEKNILGAKKVLLSIISGEKAELQMDELLEITDHITEMAGDEAEVIFGHGIDPDLGESIRVTVIATGFETSVDQPQQQRQETKSKVIDLESSKPLRTQEPNTNQIDLFNNTGQTGYQNQEPSEEITERTYMFERINKEEDTKSVHTLGLDEEDELLERIGKEQFQEFHDETEIKLDTKKAALMNQAKERIEKLKTLKNKSINEDDYKDKWDTPAYIRRKINLQDVPHSSEKNISRYNLNDDNQILGNNKFLHDNVD